MNNILGTRRSALHALAPIGVGTPATESLLSYLFRLASSHCISATNLIREVTAKMGWNQSVVKVCQWGGLKLNGVGDNAERWAHGLTVLTGVEQLDKLTLLPWRDVIAHKGLVAAPSRWCPQCFTQDRVEGGTPYFRLAWDICDIQVCPTHATRLVDACPECSSTKPRNSLTYVVPGWCSSCGAFLGDAKSAVSSNAGEMWKSAQIGAILAAQSALQSEPDFNAAKQGLQRLVASLDNGNIPAFARRLGSPYETVKPWLARNIRPTMAGHLRIASQTGVTLMELLTGDVANSPCIPKKVPELATLFPISEKRPSPRTLDLEQINAQLDAMIQSDIPISAGEAARRLGLHYMQLRRLANEKTQILRTRWREQQKRRSIESAERAKKVVEAAIRDIQAEGKDPSLYLVSGRTRGSFPSEIKVFKEVKAKIAAEERFSTSINVDTAVD